MCQAVRSRIQTARYGGHSAADEPFAAATPTEQCRSPHGEPRLLRFAPHLQGIPRIARSFRRDCHPKCPLPARQYANQLSAATPRRWYPVQATVCGQLGISSARDDDQPRCIPTAAVGYSRRLSKCLRVPSH